MAIKVSDVQSEGDVVVDDVSVLTGGVGEYLLAKRLGVLDHASELRFIRRVELLVLWWWSDLV